MQMTSSSISVVIPILEVDRQSFLKCIENIQSQSLKPDEVIFTTERNSTSAMIKSVLKNLTRSFPIEFKVVENSGNLGIGQALNVGIRHARGDIIVRHDVDDVMHSERIKKIERLFKSDNKIDVVHSNTFSKHRLMSDTRKLHRVSKLKHQFILKNPIVHPTVAFRKSTVIRFGNYDPTLRYCEDLDLWLRWMKCGATFYYITTALVLYNAPTGVRINQNWRTNLLVRIRNYKSPNVFYAALGIICMAGFVLIPDSVRAFIYRKMKAQKS